MSNSSLSGDAKEIVDLVKPVLIESAEQTRELSFKNFKNVRGNTNLQGFTEFSEEIMHDSLESKIEHIVKMYGIDAIKTLFKQVKQGQCADQIRDIISVLDSGTLANNLYSEIKINDIIYVEANKLHGTQFEEGIGGEENLLYIANELANFPSEEYEKRKQFFCYKCIAPLYRGSDIGSMIQIKNLPLYLYGDHLSNVPIDTLEVSSSREYELAEILNDNSKSDKAKQECIEAGIQSAKNNDAKSSSQSTQQNNGTKPKQYLDEI